LGFKSRHRTCCPVHRLHLACLRHRVRKANPSLQPPSHAGHSVFQSSGYYPRVLRTGGRRYASGHSWSGSAMIHNFADRSRHRSLLVPTPRMDTLEDWSFRRGAPLRFPIKIFVGGAPRLNN
jgi:hypothetical protein